MTVITKKIDYQAGDVACIGVHAYDDSLPGKRPLVLVVHDWSGCNDFAEEKAKQLAELGYIAFAVDMYGQGHICKTKDEKVATMQPLMQDRELLLSRIEAAYKTGIALPNIDTSKMGGIGFCFGGLCILDL